MRTRYARAMRRIALAVALLLLAPATAHAGIGKLIDSSTESGDSLVWPYASGYIDAPKQITYRVTMNPPAPAEGTADVTCWKGKRDVTREYPWSRSTSFTARAKLTIRRPDDCWVSVDFAYLDYDQGGTVKVELFAKQRKRDR